MTRLRARLVPALAAAAVIAGCGGDDGEEAERPAAEATPTAPPDEASERPVVEMNDALQFDPKTVTVKVGDRVEWPNVGTVAHTVTTTPSKVAERDNVEVPKGTKAWDSGLIREGERFARTFDRAGTYRYVCIPHEGTGMLGTVIVTE